MNQLAQRRANSICYSLAACICFYLLAKWTTGKFFATSILTGVTLLLGCIFLLSYNLRKKLSAIALLKSSTWMQLHIYVGFAMSFLFLVHTSFRKPTGGLESLIYFLFVFVALTGVVGLYLTRVFPERLTAKGGDTIFEEIPKLIYEIRINAESIVTNSVASTKQSTLADFYAMHLAHFFLGVRNSWSHLRGSNSPYQKLRFGMQGVRRYLSAQETEILEQLEALVSEKDRLDAQYIYLKVLKVWLFFHIPASYALMVLCVFHAVLAVRFMGS